MELWTKAAAAAAAIALGMGAAQAQASIIDWTLSDGTFDDGATFSGTFTFDSVTDTITEWSVQTGGADIPGNFYSSPGGCIFVFCDSASDNGSGPTFSTSYFGPFGGTFELTNIAMGTPGTVAALTGDENGTTGFPFGVFPFSRTVTGGEAVGVLATPEPADWALMIGGFGLAGASLRAKRRAAAAA